MKRRLFATASSIRLAAPLAAAGAVLLAALPACTSLPGPEAPPPPAADAGPLPDLWEAAGAGDTAGLRRHARAGTDLNAVEPQAGMTALTVAVGSRQNEAVAVLLERGADVDARNVDGGTALHAAAFVGNGEGAELLAEGGANMQAANAQGATARDVLALDWGTTAYIASMLQIELDQAAVEAGRARIDALFARALAERARDDPWAAVVVGDARAMRRHIRAGLDVDDRDEDSGATLLQLAALYGHGAVVALLLDAGADVDGRNFTNGSTALHAAAVLGREDVVRQLLDGGADPNVRGDDGATALDAARTDWAVTAGLGQVLRVPLDEETMTQGKAAVVKLLQGP